MRRDRPAPGEPLPGLRDGRDHALPGERELRAMVAHASSGFARWRTRARGSRKAARTATTYNVSSAGPRKSPAGDLAATLTVRSCSWRLRWTFLLESSRTTPRTTCGGPHEHGAQAGGRSHQVRRTRSLRRAAAGADPP